MQSQQICSSQIHKQTNDRIYDRNIPSQMLQPYLSVRPVITKYTRMPIVDPRKELSVKMNQLPTYNVGAVFNPGNDSAPWSGYASNVNVESDLRNQFFALQKCSQAAYVPNSSSDMYKNLIQPNNIAPQQFQGLFREEIFNNFNPNPENIGQGFFLNSTRSQIRDVGNSC